MSAVRSIRLFLKAKKYNVPFFLVVLQAVYTGMKSHPQFFVNTPIDLLVFFGQIQALIALQQAVKGGPKGTAAQRDTARDVCFSSVETLRVFVETLCTNSPEQAVTLAQAAGMALRAASSAHKPILAVKQGPHPGAVLLIVNASALCLSKGKGGRFFNWEYMLPGKDWVVVPSTTKTKTAIAGLPPLTVCSFRVSATESKTGQGEWSQVVTFSVT